jgi:hypothetical protein
MGWGSGVRSNGTRAGLRRGGGAGDAVAEDDGTGWLIITRRLRPG